MFAQLNNQPNTSNMKTHKYTWLPDYEFWHIDILPQFSISSNFIIIGWLFWQYWFEMPNFKTSTENETTNVFNK